MPPANPASESPVQLPAIGCGYPSSKWSALRSYLAYWSLTNKYTLVPISGCRGLLRLRRPGLGLEVIRRLRQPLEQVVQGVGEAGDDDARQRRLERLDRPRVDRQVQLRHIRRQRGQDEGHNLLGEIRDLEVPLAGQPLDGVRKVL